MLSAESFTNRRVARPKMYHVSISQKITDVWVFGCHASSFGQYIIWQKTAAAARVANGPPATAPHVIEKLKQFSVCAMPASTQNGGCMRSYFSYAVIPRMQKVSTMHVKPMAPMALQKCISATRISATGNATNSRLWVVNSLSIMHGAGI